MGVVIVAGLVVAGVAIAIGSALSFFSWPVIFLSVTALTIQAIIFITVRHIQLVAVKRRLTWPASSPLSPSHRKNHDDYRLFVLGSGGHTKEMLMMMDDGTCDFHRGAHRRYLISSGDTMSAHHMLDFEEALARLCASRGTDPGTHDAVLVTRARRVHQSILTTPLTALRSVLDIVPALLSRPKESRGTAAAAAAYPSLVFSNGPATGFFVAAAIHLLKMAYVLPENSARFVYIESWARISTLSLTGKLLHATGLADYFAVQHAEVARRYGVRDVGQMVFNARRD